MQLRRQHRIAYQTKIRLKTADQDESVVARVQNLSPHGVFVTAAELPEAGTEVICRLDLAGQHRTVRGRVAWVRRPSPSTPEKSPGAGIEFLDLDDRDAELLNRVVEPDPRDSKPVDVWFEGMAAPIRCQAAVLGEGVRLATRLPFLRLNSTVRVNFGGNGGGNEEGTLEAVVLEPSSEDGVPRLQLNVSLLARDESHGVPLEINLDGDPDVGDPTETSDVTSPESPPPSAALAATASDIGSLTAFPYPSLPEPPGPTEPAMAQLLGADQPQEESPKSAAEPAELPELLQATPEGAAADPAEEVASNGATAPDEAETLLEPGSSPLVSHIVRLGPPPLPHLRHRLQSPELEEKTPTISDSGSATTIPPMALATPVQQLPRRRVGLWGAAALGVVAVIAIGLVRFQGRKPATPAAPPPQAVVESRGPEAIPLDPSTGQPIPPPPAKPAAEPPAAPATPEPPISKARPGTLLVAAAGPNSRVTVPLLGTSLGARRQVLTDPTGVRLTLPRGRPKVLPGTYRPAGELFTVQVVKKQRGSELRFLYDTTVNDVSMQLDPRKVILRFKKK